MPIRANPAAGIKIIIVTITFVVSANGRYAKQPNKSGMPKTTASTRLRISKMPKILPASVKFAGM